MSQQKSNIPTIIIGFVVLILAAYFGINLTQKSDSELSAQSGSAFERAEQAAKEATENAQEAVNQAAEGASQAVDQAAQDTKQAVDQAAEAVAKKADEMTADQNGKLSPAAGTPNEPAKQ